MPAPSLFQRCGSNQRRTSPKELFSSKAQLEIPRNQVIYKGERGLYLPFHGTVCFPSVGNTVFTKP